MARGFTATWLGDDDPHCQVLEYAGHRFVKGEPVSLPASVEFNGLEWSQVIRDNPTFATENEPDEPVDAGEDEEIAAVKAELDAKRVKYRANANLDTLRKALAG